MTESSERADKESKSRWFSLSDNQQQELREMRKRHRTENKQKKILKTDSEGILVEHEDTNEDISIAANLKHLEFKLLHDLSQLQV